MARQSGQWQMLGRGSHMKRLVRRILVSSRAVGAPWSIVALVLASCDSPTGARKGEAPASIQIVSGENQSAVVGTELTLPLVAKVLDANGHGVRDQRVTFTVTSGRGGVAPAEVVSDQQGVVQARWTLGTSTAEVESVEA